MGIMKREATARMFKGKRSDDDVWDKMSWWDRNGGAPKKKKKPKKVGPPKRGIN